jgi:hypothetical protein
VREWISLIWTTLLLIFWFGGVLLIFGKTMYYGAIEWKMSKRLRLRRKMAEPEPKALNALRILLETSWGYKGSPLVFLALITLLSLLVAVPAVQYYGWFPGIVAGLLTLGFPFIHLLLRLESLRNRVSQDGEVFLGEYLASYRATNSDVLEAMAKMTAKGPKRGTLEALLMDMLFPIRNQPTAQTVKTAQRQFCFAVHTHWAEMFVYNIGIGILTGEDISLALEDIFVQLREGRVRMEKRKRMNSETARMVLFLVPGMYLLTVVSSLSFIGLEWREYLQHQFRTPQGFLLFLLMLTLFLINVLLMEMMRHQPLDF